MNGSGTMPGTLGAKDRIRHCEERSDAAIQGPPAQPSPPPDCHGAGRASQ